MKYYKLLILFLFGGFLIIISCNSQQKKGSDSEGFKYTDEELKSNLELTKSFVYTFPSPGDLLKRINETGLIFNAELMNPATSSSNYITSKEKALNLGIYITDMAYAAMFSRTLEAVSYLSVIQSLSSDINISTSTFEPQITRAKNNIGNKDSLLVISNEVFFQMVEYLEYSGKENNIALVSYGAYIESLYISINSVGTYSENSELISLITDLRFPLKNVLDHAEKFSDDPNVKSILKSVIELDSTFSMLEKGAGASEVTVDESGVITVIDSSEDTMDEESFNALKRKVEEIRNYIVNY
jgi:hypothetical protein